jgi:hypothetical protein
MCNNGAEASQANHFLLLDWFRDRFLKDSFVIQGPNVEERKK